MPSRWDFDDFNLLNLLNLLNLFNNVKKNVDWNRLAPIFSANAKILARLAVKQLNSVPRQVQSSNAKIA
jgi:hypothetical protein